MIDIDAIRADTPAVATAVHLDNSGSSLPPAPVLDAMIAHLELEARVGGYRAQGGADEQLADFYDASAAMLGCSPDEVSFTHGASEAWWRAFTAVPLAEGDVVLAGTSEFQANAFGLLQARDRGVRVHVVPAAEHGLIDLDALDRRLAADRVALVCLTTISMSNGAVQPAAEVGRRCKQAEVPLLLDACQAAGQLPLDVDELGCDFLVYTGRKFMRGPRGTGALYVRSAVRERLGTVPFVDGRSAEWLDDGGWIPHAGSATFEFGEQHVAGKIGLGVATRYALGLGLDAIAERVGALAARLRDELATIAGVDVRDEGGPRSGIVTFTHARHSAAAVGTALRDHDIHVSTPGRRNAQWDIGARGIDAVVRAGVHYFNTDDDLDRLVEVVRSLA